MKRWLIVILGALVVLSALTAAVAFIKPGYLESAASFGADIASAFLSRWRENPEQSTNQNGDPLLKPVEVPADVTSKPSAAFSYSLTSPAVRGDVQFVDESSSHIGITSWSWDFDASNGMQVDSAEQNPTHAYDNAGTYTVTLIVTLADGNRITAKHDVTVALPPNLLKNGSFETTPAWPDNWGSWSKEEGANRPTFTWPDAGRGSGNSVSIEYPTWPASRWPTAEWAQNVTIQAGKQYYLGGWMKTANVSGWAGAWINVVWWDNSGAYLDSKNVMNYIFGSNDWAYHYGIFTPPEKAVRATVVLGLYGSQGKVWFDDIVLRQYE